MKEQDILAQLLAIEDAAGLEEFLRRYPSLRPQMEAFLRLASNLRDLPQVEADAEFKERTRALFTSGETKQASQGRLGWLRRLPRLNLPVPALARPVAAGIAALLILSGLMAGTASAAERAIPGDTLYAVKLGVEKVRLALTRSEEARARLHLDLADRRLEEAALLQDEGRPTGPTIGAAARELEDALATLDKLEEPSPRLAEALRSVVFDREPVYSELNPRESQPEDAQGRRLWATLRRSRLALVSLSYDPSLLPATLRLTDSEVEAATIEVKGVAVVKGTTVSVAGMPVDASLLDIDLAGLSGRHLEVEGVWMSGGLVAFEIEEESGRDDGLDTVEVAGVAVVDGTKVTVAGVPVDLSPLGVGPEGLGGRSLEVQGTWEEGVLRASEIEQQGGDDDLRESARVDDESTHGPKGHGEDGKDRRQSEVADDDDEQSRAAESSNKEGEKPSEEPKGADEDESRSKEVEGVLLVAEATVTVDGVPVDLSLLGVDPEDLDGREVKVKGVWDKDNGVLVAEEMQVKEDRASEKSDDSNKDDGADEPAGDEEETDEPSSGESDDTETENEDGSTPAPSGGEGS